MKTETDNNISTETLNAGLAEIKDLLVRLSMGDTELRANVENSADIFREVKVLINHLADQIQKLNDDAHEMAIGLCQHYDTLAKIARGDFASRAAEDSTNELVSKLGTLINDESAALVSAVSAARRAESEKQSQLQFMKTLIDTIPSPIFYKDADCRYLGCNKAFEEYVGFTQDELVGKKPHDLWPRELADNYRKQDQAMLEKPGLKVYETSVKYADGTLRDVVFNKATFVNSDGSVGGLVGVILDITERKQAEDALIFQNVMLSTQLEASIDGVLVVDENARILSCNRRFADIMGIPNELLETKEDALVLKYVTGRMSDPKGFLEKVEYLYQHKQESCRDEIVLRDGKVLDRYTVPLLGGDGRYYGRLWSFRDITERRAAELELRGAYQRLQDIIEFLPDATFVVDNERRVIAWNRAIEKMTGLEKHEVVGKGDYIYSIPFYGKRRPILIDLIDEDADFIKHNYDYIKMEGRTLFAETYIPSFRNDGARYLWGTATPLFDVNGKQIGGIESIRDITEYKRFELDKSRMEARLAQAVMLESLMVRLGHDLRTPLTPLCILLPMLKERVSEPGLKKMLDICCNNTTTIKELTNKAGMLVKIASEIKPYELENIRLSSLVDDCLEDSQEMLATKGTRCQNEIDPEIFVQVVPSQITELFSNLISNAVRYSSQNGNVRITSGMCGGVITVAVIDDGIGLDTDHLGLVFDEFFKVDASRHDLEASGLGLSICRRIVENHHGRIWAESEGLGRGTSIVFTINHDFIAVSHGEEEKTANE